MTEQRSTERRYLVAEVQVRKPKSGLTTYAMAVNISERGLGIYTQKPLETKEKVTVQISFLVSGTILVTEEIPGTVTWVEPMDRNYAAGIMFDQGMDMELCPVFKRCLVLAKHRAENEE
jgi:hypothetical protein